MDPFLSIDTLQAAYASGDVSTVEVVEQALARIDELAHLHAFVTVTADLAREQARAIDARRAAGKALGALAGVPVAVKDLCATRGIRTTCGSGARRDWRPDTDAAVVTALREAGAVLLGKLGMTEFGYVGYHPEMEPPVNPWSASHWPGLSSSGSGVAVAAGLCAVAIGTDTGGSIRFPASACGVVGLKPTYDAISRRGVTELVGALDHVGPMTRSVRDAERAFAALAGAASNGSNATRIGVDGTMNRERVHPATCQGIERALDTFRGRGAQIVEVELPELSAMLDAYNVIFCYECARAHAELFARRAADYGPVLRAHMPHMQRITESAYRWGLRTRDGFRSRMDAVFDRIDVLVLPAMEGPAPPVGDRSNEIDISSPSARFTIPFNMTGHPTLTLPCGFSEEGLPVGLQLVARHGEERVLFDWGEVLEATEGLGWVPPQTSSS